MPGSDRDWAAILLAGGLVMAVNAITITYLCIAATGGAGALAGDATHLLAAALTGIAGLLGGNYLGRRDRTRRRPRGDE